MATLKRIRWRNIGPFGQIWQEIDFTGEACLHLMIGRNGVGKSTIMNIIRALLYLDTSGIPQGEFVNQINKCGEIEGDYISKGREFTVKLGFLPNKLQLFEDGSTEPTDKGGIPGLKAYILDEVIDIPSYIFNNVISLSINDFKSFLNMKPKDARDIRDRIFGFHLLNNILGEVRSDLYKYNQDIQKIEIQITSLKDNLEKHNTEFKGLEQKLLDDNKAKIDELQKQKESYLKSKTDMENLVVDLKKTIEQNQLVLAMIDNTKTKQQVQQFSTDLQKQRESLADISQTKTSIEAEISNINTQITNYETFKKKAETRSGLVDMIFHLHKVASTTSAFLGSIEQLKESINNNSKLAEQSNASKLEAQRNVDDITTKIALYSQDKCPTCGADFTDKDHEDQRVLLEDDLKINTDKVKTLTSLIAEMGVTKASESKTLKDKEETAQKVYLSVVSCKTFLDALQYQEFDEIKNALTAHLKDISNVQCIDKPFNQDSYMSLVPKEEPEGQNSIDALKRMMSEKKAILVEKENSINKISVEIGKLTSNIEIYTKNIKPDLADSTVTDNSSVEEALRLSKDSMDINTHNVGIIQSNLHKLDLEIGILSDTSKVKEQLNYVTKNITETEEEIITKEESIRLLIENRAFFDVIEEMLSDSGIKAYILKEIIPSINDEISNILNLVDVPMKIIFDEEFKPHVIRFGEEVNVKTISTGQKTKINFAILVAIVKIIKMKYGSINLVFFDELLATVDVYSRDVMLEILKQMYCEELKINTIIVNHSDLKSIYFDRKIEVISKNDFSHIKVVNLENPEYNIEVDTVDNEQSSK